MSRAYKLMLTASIYMASICYGYVISIIGPALSRMTDRLHTTSDIASIMFLCQYIGYTVGALIGGIIFEYVNRQSLLIGVLLIMAVTVSLTPLCASFATLLPDVAISGFGCGVVNVVIIVWIIELWGDDSVKSLLCSEIFVAVGTFLAPVISERFLSMEVTNNTQPLNANTDGIHAYFIPFFIAGALLFMTAVLFLILHMYRRYVPPMDPKRAETLTNGRKWPQKLQLVYIVLGLVILSSFVGQMYLNFALIVTFSMDSHLKLSDSEATNVQTVLTAGYTLMTALAFILSLRYWSQKLIFLFLIVIIIGDIVILLYEWCQWSGMALMVGAGLIGIGYAPIYPALYSYLGQLFPMTNTIGGVFVCFEGLMTALMPTICGQFIAYNPLVFIYMNIVLIVLCLLTYLVLNVIVFRNTLKNKRVCREPL